MNRSKSIDVTSLDTVLYDKFVADCAHLVSGDSVVDTQENNVNQDGNELCVTENVQSLAADTETQGEEHGATSQISEGFNVETNSVVPQEVATEENSVVPASNIDTGESSHTDVDLSVPDKGESPPQQKRQSQRWFSTQK